MKLPEHQLSRVKPLLGLFLGFLAVEIDDHDLSTVLLEEARDNLGGLCGASCFGGAVKKVLLAKRRSIIEVDRKHVLEEAYSAVAREVVFR